MFKAKRHKQVELYDAWEYEMGPRRYHLLEDSWAKLFHDEILPVLPAQALAVKYHKTFGRPTKEMSSVLGAILLQHMHDLTDEQTVEAFAFNLLWHYALDITASSDEAAYLCEKTLWSVRQHILALGLDDRMFDATTAKLAAVFKVDTSTQRMDSVHIKSNMRKLGRVGLFARVLHKFLLNLRRQHPTALAALDTELVARYLSEKALSCFSRVKPTESERTLAMMAVDLHTLVARFAKDKAVKGMSSYKLLSRVLDEQCVVEEDEAGELVEVRTKPPKEIPSDSLQNPSDPDASYNGHKGQGYHVQLSETYTQQPSATTSTLSVDALGKDTPAATPTASETTPVAMTAPAVEPQSEQTASLPVVPSLNLITHVSVERAHEHDAHALIPAIDSLQARGLGPKQMLADTLYGSDENRELAHARDVELIAPAPGNVADAGGITLASFTIDASGVVQSCPQGQLPVKTKADTHGRRTAAFAAAVCATCPNRAACPLSDGRGGRRRYLRFTMKELRLAQRRADERTPAFTAKYRMRSGVEGTMSQYDRRTGVKQLRVRELPEVKLSAVLKAIGINIFRAAVVRRAQSVAAAAVAVAGAAKTAAEAAFAAPVAVIRHFAAQIWSLVTSARDFWLRAGPVQFFSRS
jgi:hypothetical protein